MAQIKAIILSLLISFTLLSSHCRKHCLPVTTEKIMILQEALDYVDFKTGTYWIVRDSVTGKLDSNVVYEGKHIMEGGSDINDCGDVVFYKQYENIKLEMRRYDSVRNFIFGWEVTFNNGPKMAGNAPVDEFIIIGNGVTFNFGYPFNRTYNYNFHIITEYFTDSLVTNGGTFYNILNIKSVIDSDPSRYNLLSYAKNIGLVQAASFKNSTKLTYYYVIRYKIK